MYVLNEKDTTVQKLKQNNNFASTSPHLAQPTTERPTTATTIKATTSNRGM